MRLRFAIEAQDGRARAARVTLPRGEFVTPIFMPVGTQATVKAMAPQELQQLSAEVLLANAYHLMLRPGEPLIAKLGGLHRFMNWPRLLLTDSGGFQLFSLRQLMQIDDQGVRFRSHVDGSECFLNAERSMAVQAALGADIAMAFDHCPPSGATAAQMREAMQRTTRWAEQCLEQPRPEHQVRFGIVQGGLDIELRRQHAATISALPFEGLAFGGLSVGEPPAQMHEILDATAESLPVDRPRYLMGVGRPEDLVVAIGHGLDMFDCVMPTRNARNGQLFTESGRIVIANAEHRHADSPIDAACQCSTCRQYSRAYLRHLFTAKELLYFRLATYHNLHFVLRLVQRARQAILERRFSAFATDFLAQRVHLAQARRR